MCEHGIYTRVQTYRLVYMHVYIAELIEPLVEVIRHPLDSETLLADAAAALWLLAERNLPNAAAIRKAPKKYFLCLCCQNSLWQAMAGDGRLWQAMAGYGGLWRAMTVYNRLWQAMAGYGRP